VAEGGEGKGGMRLKAWRWAVGTSKCAGGRMVQKSRQREGSVNKPSRRKEKVVVVCACGKVRMCVVWGSQCGMWNVCGTACARVQCGVAVVSVRVGVRVGGDPGGTQRQRAVVNAAGIWDGNQQYEV